MALKKYPTMIMPTVQTAAKMPSSFGFTALRSRIMEGRDRVVTPIIKDRTTPSRAPLASSAYAMGMVPKMSAYMGMPAMVARITPRGLPLPRIVTIHASGIQLWMTAPTPTPIST